jgi:cysteine-rich secretory family protein
MYRFALLNTLLLILFGTAFGQSNLSNLSTQQLQLFNLLNGERAKVGLAKLQWDDHLSKSASAHARLLAENKELSHDFPGEPELKVRIGSTGLRFNLAGENLALAPTIEEVHKGLMNSPPHRANILSPQYNAVGIGIETRDGELYVTQNFAHTLPTYSEDDFRNGVIAAFQKARQGKGVEKIEVQADAHLHEIACTENPDPNRIITTLPDVTDLVIFTSSTPEKLPTQMTRAASDASLKRMNIGVCFKPGTEHGFGSFWVVAGFYLK